MVAALLAAAVVLPYIGDYREYVKQWALVLAGEDPWTDLGPSSSNTYGPAHNLLALPFWVHPRLPRVLSATSFALACAILSTGPGRRAGRGERRLLLALTLYNPLLWISAAGIGHNDTFVALLLVGALAAYETRSSVAGVLVAVATLLKIYPVVVAPVLALRRRRPDWRFAGGFAAAVGVVGVPAWLLWGNGFLVALTYNAARPSKNLSVFRALRGAFSPFRDLAGGWGLDPWSVPMTLAALATLYLVFVARAFRGRATAPLVLLVLLTFYKVGHAQFYTPLLLTAAYVVLRLGREARRRVLPAFALFVVWLTVVGVVDYGLSLFEIRTWMRDVVGVPTFGLALWLASRWGWGLEADREACPA